MFNPEDEVKQLREQNDGLVQSLQQWKIIAAQRENEKLELIKEVNQLRLKLGSIRSGGAAQVCQLDSALQAASQEALTHLVQASSAIARSMELAKAYVREKQELDRTALRWSNISGTPPRDRINRVPPLLIGGQSIQPVVSLSRTFVNGYTNRTPIQQNGNVTRRAVPMPMLQDVHIPLIRIDAAELLNNMEIDEQTNNINDSAEDLGLEDSSEQILESSQNINDLNETTQRLEAVIEEVEPEVENHMTFPNTSRAVDNPLEGPSWLLDMQRTETEKTKYQVNLEPDSTTELEDIVDISLATGSKHTEIQTAASAGFEYSPTVRRRKRTSSPRRNGTNGRVLKVLVAKMKLDMEDGCDASLPKKAMRDASLHRSPTRSPASSPIASPIIPMTVVHKKKIVADEPKQNPERGRPPTKDVTPKRMMRFDAPSPNGATDARVIVSETKIVPCCSAETTENTQAGSRRNRHGGARLDAQETRSDTGEARQGTKEPRPSKHKSRRDKQQSGSDMQPTRSDTRESVSYTRESRRDTKETRRERSASDSCCEARDSDSSTERTEGRVRRARKAITYKEKPLNRKLRR